MKPTLTSHLRRLVLPFTLLAAFWAAGCSGNETGIPPNTVQLTEGMVLGQPHFPNGNLPARSTIDGLICNLEQRNYHIHAHLSLFVNGQQIAIPLGIGTINPDIQKGFVDVADCFYPIHTHDASGIIHVEAEAPGTYTLGQFFDIWGQPLTASPGNVAGFQGPLTMFVNGQPYTGDPRAISITPFEIITLEVGAPVVSPPPNYFFPQSYYR